MASKQNTRALGRGREHVPGPFNQAQDKDPDHNWQPCLPQQKRQRHRVPSVKLIVQRSRKHNANEITREQQTDHMVGTLVQSMDRE